MCRYHDDPEIIAITSGRANHDIEVRCVDPTNIKVARGQPGEVIVRGYNVMRAALGRAGAILPMKASGKVTKFVLREGAKAWTHREGMNR